MKYQKLKLEFKYGPKGRFYRVVLVKKGLNLRTLGCYLVEALGGELEHMFLYKDKNNHYEDETWLDDSFFMYTRIKEFDYTKYTLDDLSQHFDFCYDTGDGYDFICTRYKTEVEMDDEEFSDRPLIILNGKGQGIREDNIGTLYDLFNGKIDPNLNHEIEEEGIYFPWNHQINKFGDFDEPLDIEALNESLVYCDPFVEGYKY